MVKDHSDSKRGNLLPPHGLLFLINRKGSFMHHPTDRIAHTTPFVTPVVEHWLEREISQWVHPMKDWSDDPSHHEWTLLPRSYISLLAGKHRQDIIMTEGIIIIIRGRRIKRRYYNDRRYNNNNKRKKKEKIL